MHQRARSFDLCLHLSQHPLYALVFDDWLAEEVRRFEAEEATPTTTSERHSYEDDSPSSTQQLQAIPVPDTPAADQTETAEESEPEETEPVDPEATQIGDGPSLGISKIQKPK